MISNKLKAARAKLKALLAARKPRRHPPKQAPRYDEVYAEGVEAMERQEVISALKGELVFCREMAEGLSNTPAAKSTMLYRARDIEEQIAQLEAGQ